MRDMIGAQVRLCDDSHPVLGSAGVMCRKGGKGHLKLELGGQDKTLADKKKTQAAISDLFSTELLTRAVFFGQTEINALLEARTSTCVMHAATKACTHVYT